MAGFQYRILDEPLAYTGKELRSGWVARVSGIEGDGAVGFRGPCRVATEDLVDFEDARAGATIEAAEMVHVIIEHPRCSLSEGVLRQRILVSILCEILGEMGHTVRRNGDDVYINDRKLTVSIAAPSPASVMIHLGINVDPTGAPIAAIGLAELGVDPEALLDDLLARYRHELATAGHAETKVRAVE